MRSYICTYIPVNTHTHTHMCIYVYMICEVPFLSERIDLLRYEGALARLANLKSSGEGPRAASIKINLKS